MKVRYNGSTMKRDEMFTGLSKDLEVGHEYLVIGSRPTYYGFAYLLEGVKGVFDSLWFEGTKAVHEAISDDEYLIENLVVNYELELLGDDSPVSRYMSVFKIRQDGKWIDIGLSSQIQNFMILGSHALRVETVNDIYMLNIVDDYSKYI